MATSRALGGSWLTTRSPMRISPPVMFSRPAIMRSSVDLPHPDGPTSTTNSRSAISIDTPCRICAVPNDLRTSRQVTLAKALSSCRSRRCLGPLGYFFAGGTLQRQGTIDQAMLSSRCDCRDIGSRLEIVEPDLPAAHPHPVQVQQDRRAQPRSG